MHMQAQQLLSTGAQYLMHSISTGSSSLPLLHTQQALLISSVQFTSSQWLQSSLWLMVRSTQEKARMMARKAIKLFINQKSTITFDTWIKSSLKFIISMENGLSNQQAAQLFKLQEQVFKPGSGMLWSPKANTDNNNDKFIACRVGWSEESKKQKQQEAAKRAMMISHQGVLQQDIEGLTHWVDQNNMTSVIVGWKAGYSSQKTLNFIKILQKRQKLVIVQPQLDDSSQIVYQQSLAKFSYDLLEHPGLLLSAISVVFSLPKYLDFSETDSPKRLLLIWRRTIPVGLANLIIFDWLQTHPNKPVLALHQQKGLLAWQLLFCTLSTQNLLRLSYQVLGID